MARLLILLLSVSCSLFIGCSKDKNNDAHILYGTWVKGAGAGDTLVFFERNGNNIMSYNLSFNPTSPAPAEAEYDFRNNKLGIKNFMGQGNNFYTAQSFEWKRTGLEFIIEGVQLFPFMSATGVYFTYHKVP